MQQPGMDTVGGSRSEEPFRIGEWLVEPALNRIANDDRSTRLEPRVMALLVCLASRAGSPISRQQLLESVWSDVVVGDEALTMAISKLRRALRDKSRTPRLVETIAKSGYRLMVPIEPAAARHRRADAGFTRDRGFAWSRWSLIAVLSLSVGLVTASIRPTRPRPASAVPEPMHDLLVTSHPGAESQGEVSPDGTLVAYVRQGRWEPAPGVYVLPLEGGAPRQLTEGVVSSPVWSPDGRRIAFSHCEGNGCEVRMVAVEGGPQQTLAAYQPCLLAGIDWSPDGRWIAVSEPIREGRACAAVRVDAETGAKHQLTDPPDGTLDARPTYSPTGDRIAFSRGESQLSHDLFIMPADGGPVRQVTAEARRIWGFDWVADGRSLVYASNRRGRFQLWRISLLGGEPSWIPVSAENVRFPSITGDRLLFDQHDIAADLWRVETGGTPVKLEALSSTRRDSSPRHSRDGRALAFVSNRSGSAELWVAEDGNEPQRETDLGASFMFRPEWSPDGRYLVVPAMVGAVETVYTIDRVTGTVAEVEGARGEGRALNPSWSADGRMIYFASDRDETWSLWRIPAGGGTPTLACANAAFGLESEDGAMLYVYRPDIRELWRQPTAGGTASVVVDDLAPHGGISWLIADGAIYYPRAAEDGYELVRQSLDSGAREAVASLPRGLLSPGLSVSPRDGSVYFSRYRGIESDLKLIANFH